MPCARPHALANILGLALAGFAVGFGGLSWLDHPAAVASPPFLVAQAPPGPVVTGEAAFWTGVASVVVVIVNGLVAAWSKKVDSNARVDALEIRMLRQAALDKAANDELVRKALAVAEARYVSRDSPTRPTEPGPRSKSPDGQLPDL